MCPERERYDREDKRRLSFFEIVPGTESIVCSKSRGLMQKGSICFSIQ